MPFWRRGRKPAIRPVTRKTAKQKRTETTTSQKTYLSIMAGKTTWDDLHRIFENCGDGDAEATPPFRIYRANIARDRGRREDQARQAGEFRILLNVEILI